MKNRVFLLLFILLYISACKQQTNQVVAEAATMPNEIMAITKKIDKNQNDAPLLYQRAQLYRMFDNDSLALRDLEKAVKIDTTKSAYFSAIGDILFDNKDISGSVKWFQRAISIDPNDETAHLKIANIFLFSKEHQKAFAEINKVLQMNVYNADAYFLKGLCYKDMGETARAISSFQTAVQTEPRYFDGFMQLGLLYTKKKDPLALQYFDNAIKVDSTNMEAHYAKAMFYQSQEEFEKAKAVFKRALSINRNYAEAHYNMGWMLLQQDSTEKARREFERVIILSPDNAKAYYNRGLCYEILGNFQNAKDDYEQARIFDAEFDLPQKALERLNSKK